jgi:hypothetical protein
LTGALDFQIPVAANQNSASLVEEQNPENFKFQREDWMLFRSLETLPQKAGVPLNRLRRLALKELVDNALDAAGSASIRQEGNRYIIEDDGPGMGVDGEAIARTFSIRRPMESSKMWRLPVRGALGNGLRVVAGAVFASLGFLAVITAGKRHVLMPNNDGFTSVASTDEPGAKGTRIEIEFGPSLPADADAMAWAKLAITGATGKAYKGAPSPFWYSADHFYEMLQAAGGRPVRSIIETLDGCAGGRAGNICSPYKATPCAALDRGQATALLGAARAHAKQVSAARLGAIGPDAFGDNYACETGLAHLGTSNPRAEIPYVVETWATWMSPDDKTVDLAILANRTPVTGEARGRKEKKTISLFGCGLAHQFEAERGSYRIVINIIAPYVPITTDGKEPDLRPFLATIRDSAQAAIKKAKRAVPKAPDKRSQKEIVLSVLDEAIAKVSDSGKYRFNCRQLFYAVRPYIISELGVEPTYGNFTAVITNHEDEHGLIANMYRDARGTLYHPHTGEDISIGTLAVETYERPKWTFNKVLFIEKEGFFEALKAAQWPERYDCALLTSKGFSTRAVRDFLDMLAEDAEEDITVFCAHDADAFGTMIFQTLQEETRARGRRKAEIINIGLEPWEAYQLGLEPEDRDKDSKEAPVADYLRNTMDGTNWVDWLQRKRFELNAMTMPQFIQWLDGKMEEHGVQKVIPPATVVIDEIMIETETHVRRTITDRILDDADVDGQVEEVMRTIELPGAEEIAESVPEYLTDNPTNNWRAWADLTALDLSQAAA